MERFEKRLDVLRLETREGYADVRRARRDQPDAVLFEQIQPKFLSVDALDLDQHEIATVEGIDLPALGEARLVGDLEDALRSEAQSFAFRFALCGKGR